jgi:hypothetical protein
MSSSQSQTLLDNLEDFIARHLVDGSVPEPKKYNFKAEAGAFNTGMESFQIEVCYGTKSDDAVSFASAEAHNRFYLCANNIY